MSGFFSYNLLEYINLTVSGSLKGLKKPENISEEQGNCVNDVQYMLMIGTLFNVYEILHLQNHNLKMYFELES